jgi:hypothetical protein
MRAILLAARKATGNYKISFEISGNIATLRRVALHDEIDRRP